MNLTKKIFLLGWFIFLTGCLGYYVSHTDDFTPNHINDFVRRFEGHLLLAYFIISFLRGFTLMPSTPFVIAGVLLFPENKIIVLLISLGGILFSSTLIYFLSEFLGFDSYFEKIASEKMVSLTNKINSPWGFLFVVLWSFFPLAPTDLVCYIAGTVRMNFLRFILAVALGELIICSFYAYSLGSLNLLQ
jgi:uncharacterized membrane protein YdjX (TVP38/TMEM64 family)